MTERRIPVLRVLLVWLLLELVAAAQVRRAGGLSLLRIWLETGAAPWVSAGQRVADLGGLLADGIANTRRVIESHLAIRLQLEKAEAYNLLLTEDLWANREAAQLPAVGLDLHTHCLVTRCSFRNLVLGRMQVSAGAADALRYDTAAVVVGGLAGRVVRLGQHASWLELITHPASAVAVRTEDGLVRGLVSGSGGELLTVQFVPRSAALIRGDLLVTSSADGIYPPGIPVATVTTVRESESPFLEVTARPTADLATARVVLLLPDWAPTSPPEWQP